MILTQDFLDNTMSDKKHYGRPGPRPHVWITGPDPDRHDRYHKFRQQRNQAQWRKETWLLTFEQWLEIWGERWSDRGVKKDQLCMSRRDWHGEWSVANCVIITRKEHAQQQFQARTAGISLRDKRFGKFRPTQQSTQ